LLSVASRARKLSFPRMCSRGVSSLPCGLRSASANRVEGVRCSFPGERIFSDIVFFSFPRFSAERPFFFAFLLALKLFCCPEFRTFFQLHIPQWVKSDFSSFQYFPVHPGFYWVDCPSGSFLFSKRLRVGILEFSCFFEHLRVFFIRPVAVSRFGPNRISVPPPSPVTPFASSNGAFCAHSS